MANHLAKDSKSGMWNLRWWENGREHRRSLRTRDRREALKLMKPLLAEVEARRHGIAVVEPAKPRGPSWAELLEAYKAGETWPKNAQTQKRYLIDAHRAEDFLKKRGLYPGEASMITVAEYVAYCRVADLSTSSIRNALTGWSRVIDAGVHLGLIPANYVLDYQRDRLSTDEALMNPPLGDEFQRMLPEIKAYDPNLALLADFLHRTGCRLTETLQITRNDIFPDDHGDLHVHLRVVKGGRGRERSPLLNSAEELLPELPARGRLFAALPPSTAQVSARWSHFFDRRQDAARRAGLEDDPWAMRRWRLHDHRHAFAINAIQSGCLYGVLQEHLGHASVVTTERYIKAMRRLPVAQRGALKLWTKGQRRQRVAGPGQDQPAFNAAMAQEMSRLDWSADEG